VKIITDSTIWDHTATR